MAKSRRDSTRAQKEAGRATERVVEEAETATEPGIEETERATERWVEEAEKTTEGRAEEAEKATERGIEETERAAERGVEALRWQTERAEQTGREAARQASATPAAAFLGATRTGFALADATEEIVEVWTHYAEDVMRNTSQASQALSRSYNIFDIMQVQIALVHDNMRSFLDQSAKLVATASRMVTQPLEVVREISSQQAPR
jgi:hypothetical protein